MTEIEYFFWSWF